jgi:hypothetical protein
MAAQEAARVVGVMAAVGAAAMAGPEEKGAPNSRQPG